jgi:chaperonin GroEL
MKEIYFKDEAEELLFGGIQKFTDAIACTLGPNGKTVIITDEYGKPKVTKDGVSVAREISFKNAVENIGAQLVKEVCELQVKQAGDGTTTAIVLANAFIQNLKGFESKDINKAFDEIIPKVIEQLKLNSKELKREDIKHVATISANNDVQIGDIIQQAYNFSNIVKAEESNNLEDTLETIEGMKLDVSYMSKLFSNTNKETCEFTNPYVLLLDGKLEDLLLFRQILEKISSEKENLLIITEYIAPKELRKLETLVLNKNINACVIKTPGFGPVRKDYLRDLSDFTGADIIAVQSNKSYLPSCLGKLGSCVINKNNSLLIKHEDVNVEDIVNSLTELSKNKELTDYDIEILNKRIANLTAKASIIKVGGGSEIEMKERKDRYDDAVLAVACALEEGIVQGGGVALIKVLISDEFSNIKTKTIKQQVLYSLSKPYTTIFPKSILQIEDFDKIVNFDLSTNMFKQNIIDPLKVTRCALLNAVSIAKTVLSTETIILNERQWN